MRKGFTLLELLIVVVIIGILALIAAPTLLNAASRARDGAVMANVNAAASSVTSEFALNDTTAATAVTHVLTKLNANNQNPVTNAANPFVDTAPGTAGQVALVAGADTDGTPQVTLTGYGHSGTAIVTKVISAPSN